MSEAIPLPNSFAELIEDKPRPLATIYSDGRIRMKLDAVTTHDIWINVQRDEDGLRSFGVVATPLPTDTKVGFVHIVDYPFIRS